MKPRTLVIGAIVASAALGAAMWVARPPAPPAEGERVLLCPTLREKGNDAARIIIRRAKAELVLERREGLWVAANRGGYPVRDERVIELVRGLGDTRIVSPKTANPGLFSRLNVEDPEGEGTGSTLVRIEDSAGGLIAGVIVGKREDTPGTTADTPRFFARRPGENQSYLVAGDVRADPTFTEWVNRTILELRNERVRSAAVLHDGAPVRLVRDKPETQSFTLENIPEGMVQKEDHELTRLAWALSYLAFDDVMPASALSAGEQPLPVEFRCFDGLLIRVLVHRHDAGDWITLNASYEPLPATGESQSTDAPAESLAREIESLNKSWSGWAYRIPAYKATALRSKIDDLVKRAEPPKESPAPPASGEAGEG
jgi:hypothetical protein